MKRKQKENKARAYFKELLVGKDTGYQPTVLEWYGLLRMKLKNVDFTEAEFRDFC